MKIIILLLRIVIKIEIWLYSDMDSRKEKETFQAEVKNMLLSIEEKKIVW